jgi:pantoate kinase
VGFGLGSSGSAALSLSYALNEALGAGLTRTQAAQIAHHAEIACKTGLGTVIAEFAGGFEMRTVAGAPGIGSVTKIDLEDYKAVVLCLAPISTKSFLTDRIYEINGLGGVMLNKLSVSKSVDEFLAMSYKFAETIGMTEGRCSEPIAALKDKGIKSGVALFGQTVFALVPESRAKEARDALRGFGGTLLVCNIDNDGARVL